MENSNFNMLNWRKSEEEPTEQNKQVLYYTINCKLGVFANVKNSADWKRLIEKYRIEYWMYGEKIAPKITE